MILPSLRARSLVPGRPGSIWMDSDGLVRSTGVSARFVCGFQTDLHFANVEVEFPPAPELLNSCQSVVHLS